MDSILCGSPPPSPARRLQDEPVSRPDLAAVDGSELLHLARGARGEGAAPPPRPRGGGAPLAPGRAGLAAFHAGGAPPPVRGEGGGGHRRQEGDLAYGAVPPPPAARPARAPADGEALQAHGV